MSQEFAQLGPGEALEEVEDRLLAGPFAVGVVVEDGQVLGILNRGDLLRVAELANSYPGVLPRQ
jgi:predicted transcriptional regulator